MWFKKIIGKNVSNIAFPPLPLTPSPTSGEGEHNGASKSLALMGERVMRGIILIT